jgi:hypothetical protein
MSVVVKLVITLVVSSKVEVLLVVEMEKVIFVVLPSVNLIYK